MDFGMLFFQIRYLKPLEDLYVTPNYLLESDIKIIKTLVLDFQEVPNAKCISWNCNSILGRNEFQVFNRTTSTISGNSAIKKWKSLMVPLGQTDSGRPIGIGPGIDVIIATSSNEALYLLCVETDTTSRNAPTYSIQQVDLSVHELKANMLFREKQCVVLAGINICNKYLVCVRSLKELQFVEIGSPAIIKTTIQLFIGETMVEYLNPLETPRFLMDNTSSFSKEYREAFIVNGPESILFVAHRGSPYLFTVDISNSSSSEPVAYHIGETEGVIGAICYSKSARELIVATTNSDYKTSIQTYSYSSQHGLRIELICICGFYQSAFCDINLIACEHLLLSRMYPDNFDFFNGRRFKIFAYSTNRAFSSRSYEMLCASVPREPRCWIIRSDEAVDSIGTTASSSGLKDAVTTNPELCIRDGLCSSSVYYIDVSYRKISNKSPSLSNQMQKYKFEKYPLDDTFPIFSLRKLRITHFETNHPILKSAPNFYDQCEVI